MHLKVSEALKGLSYPERLKHLGLPTLEYRRERADVVEVFKILNNIDLANNDKLFEMATYRTTRGHPLKLFKRRSRLSLRTKNFSLRVIDKWNVVLAPSVDSFKSRLNKHWHGHPLTFEAACYTPGESRTIVTQRRNASLQATEWPT